MGSPHGYDAGLEFDELLGLSIDRGSGGIAPGTRLTNAQTNLGQQTITNGVAVPLTNSITTAQEVFGTPVHNVTLQANTTYFFEGQLLVQTGATAHTIALNWVASTALVFIGYTVSAGYNVQGAVSAATAATSIDVSTTASTVVTSSQTTNTMQVLGILGTLKTGNAITTLRPQLAFSAGPTGTCQVNVGSYVMFYPVVSQ